MPYQIALTLRLLHTGQAASRRGFGRSIDGSIARTLDATPDIFGDTHQARGGVGSVLLARQDSGPSRDVEIDQNVPRNVPSLVLGRLWFGRS